MYSSSYKKKYKISWFLDAEVEFFFFLNFHLKKIRFNTSKSVEITLDNIKVNLYYYKFNFLI